MFDLWITLAAVTNRFQKDGFKLRGIVKSGQGDQSSVLGFGVDQTHIPGSDQDAKGSGSLKVASLCLQPAFAFIDQQQVGVTLLGQLDCLPLAKVKSGKGLVGLTE